MQSCFWDWRHAVKKNVQNPQTTAAGSENTAETTAVLKQQIKVAALKGPTAIGMVQLMENAKEQTAKNDYEFQIAATAVKTIIFSGYNEFEYAKLAVRLGVSDYILKPVNPQEFAQTIEKVTADGICVRFIHTKQVTRIILFHGVLLPTDT